MKKILLLVPFVFLSCSEYRAMVSEKTRNYCDAKIYFSDSKKEMLKVSLNNVDHDLLLDTGAGATIIYHPKFPIDEKKKIRKRDIYGFDKKVKATAYNYSLDSLKTKAFSVTNKYLFIMETSSGVCSTLGMDGILGDFTDSDYMLELNYEEGYIQFVSDFEKESYIPLEAKFNEYSGKFTINLEVNGIRDNFLFDTGNKTMTLLNKGLYVNPGPKYYTIQNLSLAVGNNPVPITIEVYKAMFRLNSQLEFECPAGIDPTSKRSVLNKSFIEKFNWVIDRKNGKVYCKPVDEEVLKKRKDIQVKINRVVSAEVNGKLLVSFMNFDSGYNIGDQIISVGNQKVNSGNICEMEKLLNETTDWKTLAIKTESTQ